ncbi:3-dehydroquinate synthase family protein [Candidatus Poriferisocius sp.]|uniref:3-dehydroquinate synthase family protein n=1 Tax=Candidatus Poriferisocius sp. TaxID=3101276 RepID=UPI003B59024B
MNAGTARMDVALDGAAPAVAGTEAAEAAGAANDPILVPVELGERSYDVWVGPGVRHRLAEVIPPGVGRVAVVTQAAVAEAAITVDPGVEHRVFITDNGEHIKTLGAVEDLCREFARWGLTRADAVVAVGGGAVTDLAGFAAAVYHRGIRMVYVATTLLAQIDASVGGKTGVNLPEGKNLVGAFWQPAAVLCDTEVLSTLPAEEMRSGLGEMAKYHFIADAELETLGLVERVARCVAIKAEVVAADEREGGRRAVLNYGHTLAHALEAHGGYDLRHGEAVAIGLVYAAELAHGLGRIDARRVAEHREVVSGYGLPVRLPAGADVDALVPLFSRDKKAVDGVTFMLDGPNGIEPVVAPDPVVVRACLEALR